MGNYSPIEDTPTDEMRAVLIPIFWCYRCNEYFTTNAQTKNWNYYKRNSIAGYMGLPSGDTCHVLF
jgi:hypothetical protein